MGTTIALKDLKPATGARKRGRRLGIGQGSGSGKTSGRGGKGQTARSGTGGSSTFEGGQSPLFMKMPKVGFRNTAFRTSYQVVHLADLSRVFKNQNEVNVEALRVHGLVKGRLPIKILGDGDLDRPLKIQAHAFSKSAQAKIEKAGGSAEVVKAKRS